MYLSHISTLEEAAAYLSEKTGDSWTPKSVLDFALAKPKQSSRKPAPIAFAAMPIGTVFGRYEFTSPGGMVRKGSARWQLVPLYPIHAAQLIAAGNTFAGLVESPDDDYADGEHYAFIEPLESEHEITLDMVRLKRAAIESIAEQYNAAASSGAPENAEPTTTTSSAVTLNKNGQRGLTKKEMLANDWPIPASINLARLLSDVPVWLEPARLGKGAPGKASALWNPAMLALCLATNKAISKTALNRYITKYTPDWADEWERFSESL